MNTLIIIAHPYRESFNHTILKLVEQCFEERKKPYVLIDLNAENFDPVLSTQDLRVYGQGKSSDPKVAEYQKKLLECDELVLIFPIWWYEAPAIFKGFLDKVLLPNFAFEETEAGLIGRLDHIKRTTVLSSSEVLSDFMIHEVGNPIEISLMNTTLSVCGITEDKVWINCEKIASGTQAEREAFLEKVKARFTV